MEYLSLYMFLAVCLLLMLGYPVAFTLAGTALAFAAGGIIAGVFDASFLSAFPGRVFGGLRGGLGISVVVVGMFLAASTGIVGATVVTMGLLSLPSMLLVGIGENIPQ